MQDLSHQLTVAVLVIVGCIKFILGYYVARSSLYGYTLRPLRHFLRHTIKRLTSFPFLLGLTKITCDATIYLLLAWSVSQSAEPIPLWGVLYLLYSLTVQFGTFLQWSRENNARLAGK